MEIQVVVTSSETIKPSSPTPNDRRHLQISFLDQISPQIYMTRILFYPFEGDSKTNNQEKCERLKKALSETLARFYPLAGRIKGNSFIDCTDEGAPFLEAQAKCQLSDLVEPSNLLELNKLLPFKPSDDAGEVPLALKMNIFNCGGMAIGVCMSHKIADALSFINFINSWAAASSGDSEKIVDPQFQSAKIFPPKDIPSVDRKIGGIEETIARKRLVFSALAIDSLKKKYANSLSLKNEGRPPSRVEAVTTFIWSRFIEATGQKQADPRRCHLVTQAVNLRTRMDPPLPDNYFGNFSQPAIAMPSIQEKEEGHGLVITMREAVKKIDSDRVKQLQEPGDHYLNQISDFRQRVAKGDLFSFNFSSICRFPVYEADFGWGKPIWACLAPQPFNNLASILSNKSGDGMEVWINLNKDDMAKFEKDTELLAIVSPITSAQVRP